MYFLSKSSVTDTDARLESSDYFAAPAFDLTGMCWDTRLNNETFSF